MFWLKMSPGGMSLPFIHFQNTVSDGVAGANCWAKAENRSVWSIYRDTNQLKKYVFGLERTKKTHKCMRTSYRRIPCQDLNLLVAALNSSIKSEAGGSYLTKGVFYFERNVNLLLSKVKSKKWSDIEIPKIVVIQRKKIFISSIL